MNKLNENNTMLMDKNRGFIEELIHRFRNSNVFTNLKGESRGNFYCRINSKKGKFKQNSRKELNK